MPLIAIEYSKTTILPADARAFLKGLHSVVHNTIDADFNSIKSWLCPHQQFLIGNQAQDAAGYMLLNIHIMQGRTMDEKTQLGEKLLDYLKQVILPLNASHEVQLRVKVDEISQQSYFAYG